MPTWAQKSPSNRKRFNENWRKWYRENRERKIAWQKRRREELRAWFRDLKTTKSCARCGERTVECLQFHHRDPSEKLFDVSDIIARWSRERILVEIAKCDVLCANCHLKHHWEARRAKKKP
jgi:transcription elongation factor Elf1